MTESNHKSKWSQSANEGMDQDAAAAIENFSYKKAAPNPSTPSNLVGPSHFNSDSSKTSRPFYNDKRTSDFKKPSSTVPSSAVSTSSPSAQRFSYSSANTHFGNGILNSHGSPGTQFRPFTSNMNSAEIAASKLGAQVAAQQLGPRTLSEGSNKVKTSTPAPEPVNNNNDNSGSPLVQAKPKPVVRAREGSANASSPTVPPRKGMPSNSAQPHPALNKRLRDQEPVSTLSDQSNAKISSLQEVPQNLEQHKSSAKRQKQNGIRGTAEDAFRDSSSVDGEVEVVGSEPGFSHHSKEDDELGENLSRHQNSSFDKGALSGINRNDSLYNNRPSSRHSKVTAQQSEVSTSREMVHLREKKEDWHTIGIRKNGELAELLAAGYAENQDLRQRNAKLVSETKPERSRSSKSSSLGLDGIHSESFYPFSSPSLVMSKKLVSQMLTMLVRLFCGRKSGINSQRFPRISTRSELSRPEGLATPLS